MTPLAKQLRDARTRSGLSRQQAAERTGVSRRTIEDWEIGRRSPKPLTRDAYLRLLSE